MVIKREVAYGIVRGMEQLWDCEELQDFIVTVGKTHFGCHKFLLAACSDYFRALFRSGMRETKQNSVTIGEISSETFQLILQAFYTGRDILTHDNVIDIWKAASQLQVTFMIEECETFVLNSLSVENHAKYFYYGKILSSKIVTKTIWKFILKHCNYFFNSTFFLEMSFDDVLGLIKSQDLETNTEDEVLKAIFKWVEYKPYNDLYNDRKDKYQQGSEESKTSKSTGRKGDEQKMSRKSDKSTTQSQMKDDANNIGMFGACRNKVACDTSVSCDETKVACDTSVSCDETKVACDTSVSCDETEKIERAETESDRRKYLFDLVSASRTYLVSQECLAILLSHPLVIGNKEIIYIFSKALMYQLDLDTRCGQWISGAIHRNNSDHENVAVRVRNESVEVFSFYEQSWREYRCDSFCSDTILTLHLIATNRSLVCLYVDQDEVIIENGEIGRHLYICLLRDTIWYKRMVPFRMQDIIFSAIAVDEFIYVLNRTRFLKFNPSSPSPIKLPDLPVDQPMCHLTVYDQKILAFYSVSTESGVDETAVLSFDIPSNTWTRLNNLEGPADGMTSFKDDHSTYLLQSNGDLWKLVKSQSDAVDIEFVIKLWQCDWPLHGAVKFLDELYIYGIESKKIVNDPLLLKSFDGFFKRIIYLQSGLRSIRDCKRSMFLPFIVNKNFIGSEVHQNLYRSPSKRISIRVIYS